MPDWAQNTDFLPSLRRYRTTPRQTDRQTDTAIPTNLRYGGITIITRKGQTVKCSFRNGGGICMHIYNHIYTDALTHTRVHAAMYVHSQTHTTIQTHPPTHTRERMCSYTPTHTHGHACSMHVLLHTHTHTHEHTHTRTGLEPQGTSESHHHSNGKRRGVDQH